MREIQHQTTLRMSAAQKKKLDDLALKTGLSINQTLLNLIDKNTENNELKTELSNTKDQVNLLSEAVGKQTKAIVDLIGALKNKGVI